MESPHHDCNGSEMEHTLGPLSRPYHKPQSSRTYFQGSGLNLHIFLAPLRYISDPKCRTTLLRASLARIPLFILSHDNHQSQSLTQLYLRLTSPPISSVNNMQFAGSTFIPLVFALLALTR